MLVKYKDLNLEKKWEINENRKIAIIRIRGRVGIKPDIRETLNSLRLRRKNVCVVLNATREVLGMVKRIESYVTWGDIDKETFKELLIRRGKISSRRKLTLDYVKQKGFKDFDELVNYLWENPLKKMKELGIKPVFFLNSPSKGYGRKGIKEFFHLGGALGYRGKYINELIRRMI